MEVALNFVSSSPPFPPRTQLRNNPSSYSACSSSGFNPTVSFHVTKAHEQASTPVSFMPTTFMSRSFPIPVQLQEQHDDSRPLLRMLDKNIELAPVSQRKQIESIHSVDEDNEYFSDQLLRDFQHQLSRLTGLSSLFPSIPRKENPALTNAQTASAEPDMERLMNLNSCYAISLAVDALTAAKEAASLATKSQLVSADCDESFFSSSVTSFLEDKYVRSTRHLERQAKKRKVSKPPKVIFNSGRRKKAGSQQEFSQDVDPSGPLRLFFRVPESKKPLTLKEETFLISEIQDLYKLEEARSGLHSLLDREPSLVEWAEAVGKSCRQLQSQLHSGNRSREKLIYANLSLVVHIAKQYRGSGLSFQDLLQAGSIGLMKSVDKVKPQAAARFGTYAYWWIRQAMRLAIHKNSRIVQLPGTLYDLQRKVKLAKKCYIQEGHHHPTNEQLAQRVGITMKKFWDLKLLTRKPLSLQQPVWPDQATTFQEITADTAIENPELVVMRKHVHSLLNSLNPKERQVIKLRYGIGYRKQYTSPEIGAAFNLTTERIRKIETCAVDKLKQSLSIHGLEAYANLLV